MLLRDSEYVGSIQPSEDELRNCRKLLEGFLDLHVHLAPDTVRRYCDGDQFASDVSKIGYRGFIMKDHYIPTPARSYQLRKGYPKLAIHGGIALNRSVGGFNPEAVKVAIQLGVKQVWMPTFDSANHFKHFGAFGLPNLIPVVDVKSRTNSNEAGLTVLDQDGEIRQDVEEILSMIADSNIILGTGHLGLEEIYLLIDTAQKVGVHKILVTHPEFMATTWPVEDQIKLAEKGAIMEHCANMNFDAKFWASNIKRVGAERCVLSSDSGQVKKGHPAIVMKEFVEALMAEGITESGLDKMMRSNPMKLLDPP
ncbi:MAG: DUF6282 family protein [Thaumarchaeota archaeon]|nr:DUF6282 family protein [Nitrososphaerota archaeon]